MEGLKKLPIWLKWRKEQVQKPGNDSNKSIRYTKIPYQINGYKASSVNPEHWVMFEEAEKYQDNFDGTGFSISPKYPLLCIDLDHCIKDGKITREDLEILVEESDTYTELSPSGDGLHIIFELEKHFSLITNKKTNEDGTAIEFYTENRYFTYTDNPFSLETTDRVQPERVGDENGVQPERVGDENGVQPERVGDENEVQPKRVRKISIDEANMIIRMVGYPWGKREDLIQETVSAENVTYTINSDVLLKKMFKAKGGAKLKRLYEGSLNDYNDDGSSGDAALVTALAFWTAKNINQMEEIWLASPLGQREKTQKRKDYRDRTIQNILPLVSSVYKENRSGSIVKDIAPIKPTLIEEIVFDGENSNKGMPHKNVSNVERIIRADSYLTNAFRFNSFSDMNETNIDNGKDWVPLENAHSLIVLQYIQLTYSFFENLSKMIIDDAIVLHAMHKRVNPPLDLIKSVEWDGTDRINNWLFEVFGADQSELTQKIASNWLKGLINRVVSPGCQFDTVLVLEGAQGIGKSSVLRALGDPWYAETTLDTDTKDFQLVLTQNIIVEFSEGATLTRSETKSLKQTITEREDNFRRPYEKLPKKFPRHCVFAMTTNEEQYLKDNTGNRRWLPISLPDQKANVEWMFKNRVQLYAEAYHRVYVLKETTYEFPEQELKIAQEDRMEEDPWVTAILNWYFDECTDQERDEGITNVQVFNKALWDITRKEFTSGQSQRIASILRNSLKLNRVQKKKNSVRTWRYFQTDETKEIYQNRGEIMTDTEKAEKAHKAAKISHANEVKPVSVNPDGSF